MSPPVGLEPRWACVFMAQAQSGAVSSSPAILGDDIFPGSVSGASGFGSHWQLNTTHMLTDMASSDFAAEEFDLGTTSVRLVRIGNVIQLIYSNKLDAKLLHAELSSRFKRI